MGQAGRGLAGPTRMGHLPSASEASVQSLSHTQLCSFPTAVLLLLCPALMPTMPPTGTTVEQFVAEKNEQLELLIP